MVSQYPESDTDNTVDYESEASKASEASEDDSVYDEDYWLCCFSNRSMPGILVVSLSDTTPAFELQYINEMCMLMPVKYEMEFACTIHHQDTEAQIMRHIREEVLGDYHIKYNFYGISVVELKDVAYIKECIDNASHYIPHSSA